MVRAGVQLTNKNTTTTTTAATNNSNDNNNNHNNNIRMHFWLKADRDETKDTGRA